ASSVPSIADLEGGLTVTAGRAESACWLIGCASAGAALSDPRVGATPAPPAAVTATASRAASPPLATAVSNSRPRFGRARNQYPLAAETAARNTPSTTQPDPRRGADGS